MATNRIFSDKDLETARGVIAAGYYQVSSKYCMVARLPAGMSGSEALQKARGADARNTEEASAGDTWLRCHSTVEDQLVLTSSEWRAFKHLGGDTYFKHRWKISMTDAQARELAAAAIHWKRTLNKVFVEDYPAAAHLWRLAHALDRKLSPKDANAVEAHVWDPRERSEILDEGGADGTPFQAK